MISNKIRIRKINAGSIFKKEGVTRKSSDLVILGKENNKYEILKKKSERLIKVLNL